MEGGSLFRGHPAQIVKAIWLTFSKPLCRDYEPFIVKFKKRVDTMQGESLFILFACVVLIYHIGMNVRNIRKKWKFLQEMKVEMDACFDGKEKRFLEKEPIYVDVPLCEYEDGGRCKIRRLYRDGNYFVLFEYFRREVEKAVYNNLSMTEMTKDEKNAFLKENKPGVKEQLLNNWKAEKASFSELISKWKKK